MTNAGFTRLDQYRDLESINAYRQRVEEAKVQTSESMMESLARASRDNSRTPMQWDASVYAGFTDPDAACEPWISVNPNKNVINVKAEKGDPESVLSFYRRLIALRHANALVSAGDFAMLDDGDPRIYSFTRSLGSEVAVVAVNISGGSAPIPEATAALIGDRMNAANLLISTSADEHTKDCADRGFLDPWMGFVYRIH